MAIGGVLGYFSFLVVPLLASYGYQIEVLSSTASGDRVPPDFEGWLGSAWVGFKAAVVAFLYVFVPNLVLGTVLVVVFVLLGGLGPAEFANPDRINELGLVLLGIAGVVTVFVELLIAYLLPAAMVNFAAEGSMRAAFGVRSVFGLAASGPYFLSTLLVPVVGFVVLVLSLTVVGTVLAPAVAFWGTVATTRLFGIAYRKVHDVPVKAPVPAGTRPGATPGVDGPAGTPTVGETGGTPRGDPTDADEPRESTGGRPEAVAESGEEVGGVDSSAAEGSTPETVTFEGAADAKPPGDPGDADGSGGSESRKTVDGSDADGSSNVGAETDGSETAGGLEEGDRREGATGDDDGNGSDTTDAAGATGRPDEVDEKDRSDGDESDAESNRGPPRV